MDKSSSRGFVTALLFFIAGLLAGTLIAVLLHTLTAGKFETAYLWDLPSWLLGVLVAVVAFLYALVGYWGIVRGLLWQVAGTIIGGLLFSLLRVVLGLLALQAAGVEILFATVW